MDSAEQKRAAGRFPPTLAGGMTAGQRDRELEFYSSRALLIISLLTN